MRIGAIIFDFDGLLMDTESTMLESWQYEWRHHGLELDLASHFAEHGGDLTEERYQRLAEAVGAGFDLAESRLRRETYRDELNASLGLREGMDVWLDQARSGGLRRAIASSSPRSWVTGHLAHVGRMDDFDVLAFGDEVAAHKPAPDVYRLALERLGLAPTYAVAVEDTPHGVAAAKGAGLRCIAVPNPHQDPTRFGAADVVLASATDAALADVLAQL